MNAAEARALATKVKQTDRKAEIERQRLLLINQIKTEAREGSMSLTTPREIYSENLLWLTKEKYNFHRNYNYIGGYVGITISWEKVENLV